MRESDYLHVSQETVGTFLKIPTLKYFGNRLTQILQLSKVRQYDPEEQIIAEGGRDHWIFCLISGKARVEKDGQPISSLHIGDIFGEMSIIDGSARSASVFATERTICLASDVSRLERSSGENEIFLSILYRVFATMLASRLRQANEQLIQARREIARLKGDEEPEQLFVLGEDDVKDIEALFPMLKS